MAQDLDLEDPSGMASNQSYRADSAAHFGQPQYSFTQANAGFTVDQDMDIPETFTTSMNVRMNNATADTLQNGQIDPMSANAGPMGTQSMVPPQTPNSHSFSASATVRRSVDEGQDLSLMGGDSKRKRSKVSRACDQCRKKKVRCDAETDTGALKTCTNCSRANTTCEYSRIPQKRGPSKGYIKELSERVQQVEGQLALQNTAGFRSSVDGNTGLYADPSYSPDEDHSLRRQFSFSDQRSPFTNPEYNRDRIPSVGGWQSNSPQPAGFRLRDRGSLAIAPDQSLPTSAPSADMPFWTETRSSKRLKLSTDSAKTLDLNETVLGEYYKEFHTNLPILPDADIALGIIQKADPLIQHAFCAATTAFPFSKPTSELKHTNGDSSIVTIFRTRSDLEDFVIEKGKEVSDSRSGEDDLVLMWMFCILAVQAENDLSRLQDCEASKGIHLKAGIDLGWRYVKPDSFTRTDIPADSQSDYTNHWIRAWYCISILARLHAVGVGTDDPLQVVREDSVPPPNSILGSTPTFLALSAPWLAITASIMKMDTRNVGRSACISIQKVMHATRKATLPIVELSESDPVVKTVQLLIELMTCRNYDLLSQIMMLSSAIELAGVLRAKTTASSDDRCYNPLDIHAFTLTTITLLEFSQGNVASEMIEDAAKALDEIKAALEQLAERNHHEENNEEEKTQQNGTVGGDEGPPVKNLSHWVDALLNMINRRHKLVDEGNEVAKAGGNMVDLSLLLKTGHMVALATYSGF